MARRTNTEIAGVIIDYPEQRVFAFNPNYIKISGLVARDEIEFIFNYKSIIRYANYIGEIILPLQGILSSFFKNVEFGEMTPFYGQWYNSKTKSIEVNSPITINRGEETTTIYFDIIWGALQIGEIEPINIEIYQFGSLPLTITKTIGNIIDDNNGHSYLKDYGVDIDAVAFQLSNTAGCIRFLTDTVINKKYTIIYSPCETGYYLKWINLYGEMCYFLLQFGQSDLIGKAGNTFNYFPISNDPINNLYKQKKQLKEKIVNNTVSCGVVSATENQTVLLETLLTSIKQWLYKDGNWIEVSLADMTISRKSQEGRRQIDVNIILPEYYTQQL